MVNPKTPFERASIQSRLPPHGRWPNIHALFQWLALFCFNFSAPYLQCLSFPFIYIVLLLRARSPYPGEPMSIPAIPRGTGDAAATAT